MKFLLLLILISCSHKKQVKVESCASAFENDRFYKFVESRSTLDTCKTEEPKTVLTFKNEDTLVFDKNIIAPGKEVFLRTPIEEKEAFDLAKIESNECKFNLNKPTEIKFESLYKRKIFWCGENSAFSLDINSLGKVISFRTWMVH